MSKIEWTDETWNPIAGCNDVSEGCRNCYARGMAKRLEAMGSEKYAGLTVLQGSKTVWTGKISFDEAALLAPLKRRMPTRYFVNSMSDLFHPNVTDEMRDRIFAVMALCPQHTFQVLTKRPERMLGYVQGQNTREDVTVAAECEGFYSSFVDSVMPIEKDNLVAWPLTHVHLGLSVESQPEADKRIPYLRQTPAAVRFLIAEPLLGSLDLRELGLLGAIGDIDWVIVGGESGHGARPMHPDWVRSLRDQCVAAGVPFFFKQWGEWIPFSTHKLDELYARFPAISMKTPTSLIKQDGRVVRPYCMNDAPGHEMIRVGKKAAGRLLDGREWNEVPA